MARFPMAAPLTLRATLSLVAVLTAFFVPSCGPNSRCPAGMVCRERPPVRDPLQESPFDDGMTTNQRKALIARVISSVASVGVNYQSEDGIKEHGGTAVALDDRGTLLTARHVIVDAKLITAARCALTSDGLTMEYGPKIEMRVLAQDEAHDVAIIVPARDGDAKALPAPLRIAVGWHPVNGEQLWQFGRTSKWSRGLVTDADGRATSTNGDVELGFTVRPGDSGGPVVRTDGSLVGIVLSRIDGREDTAEDDRGFFLIATIGFTALHYRPDQ